MTGPHLAVAIVSHNTADDLARCLASLAQGGLDGLNAAVWVVDNASADDSLARTQRDHGWVQVIANQHNAGFAAASNQALRAAGFGAAGSGAAGGPTVTRGQAAHPTTTTPSQRAQHALLLNPDTIVPRGALAALVAALEAEVDLGVVGPKLLLPDGRLDRACRRAFPTPEVSFYRFTGLARLFPRHRRFARYNMTFLDEDAPADVDSVVGACMLVRGAAIEQVGLLDERFWMYGEDLDWALRITQCGWRVAYRPHVIVHHIKRAASRTSPKARYEFQRAMWLFYRKHYRTSTPSLVHLLVLAGLALRGGPRLTREMLGGAP